MRVDGARLSGVALQRQQLRQGDECSTEQLVLTVYYHCLVDNGWCPTVRVIYMCVCGKHFFYMKVIGRYDVVDIMALSSVVVSNADVLFIFN